MEWMCARTFLVAFSWGTRSASSDLLSVSLPALPTSAVGVMVLRGRVSGCCLPLAATAWSAGLLARESSAELRS